MSQQGSSECTDEMADKIAANWGWFLALGAALVILGTAAISSPLYGTTAGARTFAWLMFFGGAATAVHALSAREWSGVIFQVIIAIVYSAGGIWLLTQPASGALPLTLVLIWVLLIHGIFTVLESAQIRPAEGWVWMLVSGVSSVLFAIMLWMKFPSSALWAIGLLFGL
ncbi:MAG: DUF308 domain-containing protein, partial [Hyphomicrobium sp.]